MEWITLLVSAVVSALVSLLFGPLRAKWEEAARRDLTARREVARYLRALIFLLQRELFERKNPRGSSWRLSMSDVEKSLWQIIQALDSPDLNRKTRDRVYNELKRLAGARIELLKIYPPGSVDSWKWATLTFVRELEGLEQKGHFQVSLLDEALSAHDPASLEQLIRELEKLEEDVKGRTPRIPRRTGP